MGFEPTTPTLARLCSTPELRPRIQMFADRSRQEGLYAASGARMQDGLKHSPPAAGGTAKRRPAAAAFAVVLSAVETLAIVAALYLGAAALGSVALGPSWTERSERRITIYVVSNGYPVDLVPPVVEAAKD